MWIQVELVDLVETAGNVLCSMDFNTGGFSPLSDLVLGEQG
jgi:hypothetical protein